MDTAPQKEIPIGDSAGSAVTTPPTADDLDLRQTVLNMQAQIDTLVANLGAPVDLVPDVKSLGDSSTKCPRLDKLSQGDEQDEIGDQLRDILDPKSEVIELTI